MPLVDLTQDQQEAVDSDGSGFWLGPAGTGKSTALQQRLLRLLRGGEPAYAILVLVAEPDQRESFVEAVRQSEIRAHGDLQVVTFNQLAREMVSLFWPLVARPAGFERPFQPPSFLSYDLAQLLMWHVVTPMLEQGAFADLRMRPQQIVSQLLDTLNRAALNSLSLDEAIQRQIDTWTGEPERRRHLQDAGNAARSFRRACLRNSLLDLSLIVEVFDRQVVQHPEFTRYFSERFRHLIVDNVEEQTPAGQDFVQSLMPAIQSTAIAYDAGGGYKRFLAADPLEATKFRDLCQRVFTFDVPFTAPRRMGALANLIENFLMGSSKEAESADQAVTGIIGGRYRHEMVANLVLFLSQFVADGVCQPDEIAIIAPYLDGALRYTLGRALKQAGLPYRFLRRRSSPREEPRVRAWLTWLALANPDWEIYPSAYDVAEALTLSVHDLDAARAQLLVMQLYDASNGTLASASELPEQITERVGPEMVELTEEIRVWLGARGKGGRIETFLHDLFVQLLSQPSFQPESDYAGAAICEWLVNAAARLHMSAEAMGFRTPAEIGVAFIEGIYHGLVTAHPPDLGDPPDPDGITISTIYGYLLAGRPVQLQIWLDAAATGWWDIPNQPLSNAFVLAQSRAAREPWTMEDDAAVRNLLLSRIVRGLTSRCGSSIVLANSDLDRRGQRQDGPLWRALRPVRAKTH